VLREVGPMAVTTANKVGQPAPKTAEEAREQLEYAVRIYLEAGPAGDPAPSTVVDVTGDVPRVLRAGAIPLDKLRDVVPDLLAPEE
jgi:tRNA A37 threonylcarbamoyladenosine synthetase subunit TsaC/SUA5/YrdC